MSYEPQQNIYLLVTRVIYSRSSPYVDCVGSSLVVGPTTVNVMVGGIYSQTYWGQWPPPYLWVSLCPSMAWPGAFQDWCLPAGANRLEKGLQNGTDKPQCPHHRMNSPKWMSAALMSPGVFPVAFCILGVSPMLTMTQIPFKLLFLCWDWGWDLACTLKIRVSVS